MCECADDDWPLSFLLSLSAYFFFDVVLLLCHSPALILNFAFFGTALLRKIYRFTKCVLHCRLSLDPLFAPAAVVPPLHRHTGTRARLIYGACAFVGPLPNGCWAQWKGVSEGGGVHFFLWPAQLYLICARRVFHMFTLIAFGSGFVFYLQRAGAAGGRVRGFVYGLFTPVPRV